MQMAGEEPPFVAEYPFMAGLIAEGGPSRQVGERPYSTQSAHFGTSVAAPQGMIGTVEVEFFGEPSIK